MKLTLILTHQCDLACSYCYAGAKDGRRMSPSIGRRSIDRALRALAPGDDLDLGLFGGEPLLEWPLAQELIAYARRAAAERGAEVAVHLTTNGTRLTEALLEQARALGVRLTISMDGLPEVHDAFRPTRGGRPSSRSALRAIELLVRQREAFYVNSVVRPETVHALPDGVRFLADRGVRNVLPSLDYSAPWRPSDAPLLEEAVRGLRLLYVERAPALYIGWLETKALLLANPALPRPRCGAGRREVAVAPSGRLYPCERLVGADLEDEGWGHVDDEGPLRIQRPLSSAPSSDAPCGACSVEALCANDCACASSARTGRADLPDGLICTLERACLREAALALQELSSRRRRLPLVPCA